MLYFLLISLKNNKCQSQGGAQERVRWPPNNPTSLTLHAHSPLSFPFVSEIGWEPCIVILDTCDQLQHPVNSWSNKWACWSDFKVGCSGIYPCSLLLRADIRDGNESHPLACLPLILDMKWVHSEKLSVAYDLSFRAVVFKMGLQ